MNDGKGLHFFESAFNKGMNRDASLGKYPKDSFFNIKNLKLYSNKEGSFFDLENVDSDERKLMIYGGFIPEKIVEGKDSVYLLGSFNSPLYTYIFFCIYRIDKNKIEESTDVTLNLETITKYTPERQHGAILLHDGYDTNYNIDFAVYNYESDQVYKIYWKDDLGYRFVDVEKSLKKDYWSLEDTKTYSELLEISAKFEGFGSGSLKNGAYFYTYQFYNLNGKETSFAPLSDVIYVTDRFSQSDYKEISLGKVGDNSFKSVLGKVENVSGNIYDMIRIISVYYSSKNSTPTINIITEKAASSVVFFTDIGKSLGVLSSEELLFRNVILSPSTATIKDNYLFIGNVDKKDYFDVDDWIKENNPDNPGLFLNSADSINTDKYFWESRAFSFGVYNNYPKGEEEYRVDIQQMSVSEGSAPEFWVKFDPDNYPLYKIGVPSSAGGVMDAYTDYGLSNIPESSDCIHPGLYDIKEEHPKSHCRVYRKGGTIYSSSMRFNETAFGLNPNKKLANGVPRYGGYGVNVEYYFEPFNPEDIIFSDPAFSGFNSNIITPGKDDKGFYDDFTSPDKSRDLIIPFDEIDRYGIQFKENSTGRVSYVKWIGDIRSPEVNSYQNLEDSSGTYVIIGSGEFSNPMKAWQLLKLVFEVKNVPAGLSWRIVRVPKEVESDYTNKMTGMLSGIYMNFARNARNYVYPTRKYAIGDENLLDLSSMVSGGSGYSLDKFISPDYLLDNTLASIIESKKDSMYFKNAGQVFSLGYTRGSMEYYDGGYIQYATGGYTNLRSYLSFLHDWRNVSADSITPIQKADFIKFLPSSDKSDIFRLHLRAISTPKSIDGVPVRYYHDLYNADGKAISLSGTGLILGFTDYDSDMYKTKDSVSGHAASTGDVYNTLPMISILEDNFYSRFGGSSYTDRAYNIYNPVSSWNKDTENLAYVKGTHYAGIFEYLSGHIYEDLSIAESYNYRNLLGNAFTWFPVISRKNFNYSSSALFRKLENSDKGAYGGTDVSVADTAKPMCITEKAGIFSLTFTGSDEIKHSITYLDQEEDYYAYNDVYELNRSMLELCLTKPINLQNPSRENTVTNSLIKIDNEYADSWLKFNKTSLNLDYTQGKLIDIFTLNNNIYYFQEKGFGRLYSNERQTMSEGQSSIIIAKGPVLERFNTITDFTGIRDKKHYATSESAIYWYDSLRKELRMFNGEQVADLGSFIGIASYIKNINIKHLYYDVGDKELLITSWKESGDDVIIEHLFYNEVHKAIVGKVEYSTQNSNFGRIYFETFNNETFKFLQRLGGAVLVNTPESPLSIFKKDITVKARFIGNYEKSELEFIVNPDRTNVSILEFISILVDVYQSGFPTEFENIAATGEFSHLDVIEKIEFFNSYQVSKVLTAAELKTHYRKVRANTIVEDNLDNSKLKDYFHKVKITFKGTTRRIVLREIITGFTKQRI